MAAVPTTPPTRAAGARPRGVLGWAAAALAGLAVGVVTTFVHAESVSVGGSPRLPAGLLVALGGAAAVVRLAGAAAGRPAAAAALLGWVAAVVVLLLPRPEGDVLVASGPVGTAYLLLGPVAAAAGVALTPPRPRSDDRHAG